MRIAIMQGRLLAPQNGRFQSFPCDLWQAEFPLASAAGLDAIEWIYDLQGADVNPIATDDGVREMDALSKQYAIAVVSICADYFIDRPFVTATPGEFIELVGRLRWLLERCRLAGIERIVLPFVDGSRMETAEQQRRVAEMLRQTLPWAENTGVEIHLETSLEPESFARFLKGLPHSSLKANYDSGNSASLGFDVREELATYGVRIGSVHIKDRILAGGTVPLGEGNADIPALLSGLAAISYGGDYVLQVARGKIGDELNWTRRNRAYLMRQLTEALAMATEARQ
jgi:L-ribulose-5-phosphate 3-epimerase